jgi:cellulase
MPEDLNNGFIAPDAYANPDIIYHLNATNAQASATVKAGGTVELQWTAWPSSHHGPVAGRYPSRAATLLFLT